MELFEELLYEKIQLDQQGYLKFELNFIAIIIE